MKMSLLDMVQNILVEMNSDNVNSISDTVESEQVASIIRTTYFNLIATRDLPTLQANINLNNSGDINKKASLVIPENVSKIHRVYYNNKLIKWMHPEEFSMLMQNRALSGEYTATKSKEGFLFFIGTKQDPQYYTSYNDKEFLFDSYNESESETLVGSRSLAYAEIIPIFRMEDSFVPEIPMHMFPYLLETAKSVCFLNVKQMPNAAVERNAQQLKASNSRDKRISSYSIKTPNYGRK